MSLITFAWEFFLAHQPNSLPVSVFSSSFLAREERSSQNGTGFIVDTDRLTHSPSAISLNNQTRIKSLKYWNSPFPPSHHGDFNLDQNQSPWKSYCRGTIPNENRNKEEFTDISWRSRNSWLHGDLLMTGRCKSSVENLRKTFNFEKPLNRWTKGVNTA